jgi:hypothetical protein
MLTAEKKRVSADLDVYLDEDLDEEEILKFPIAVHDESDDDESGEEFSEEEFQKMLQDLPESDIDYPEEYLRKLDEEAEEAMAYINAGKVIQMTTAEFDKLMQMTGAEHDAELVRIWKARDK